MTTQPGTTNPSQNAVTGSSGTHPVPEGAADNAPPAIREELLPCPFCGGKADSGNGFSPSERFEGDEDVAPMPTIWLQPWCKGCDKHAYGSDGRQWCEDEVWGECEECGRKPVKYTLLLHDLGGETK